jgi:hypothetical protein
MNRRRVTAMGVAAWALVVIGGVHEAVAMQAPARGDRKSVV